MFLNNRYQDPTTGIFLSVDPLVATTGDPYLYANGNPTTLSDPSGQCSEGRDGCGIDYDGSGRRTSGQPPQPNPETQWSTALTGGLYLNGLSGNPAEGDLQGWVWNADGPRRGTFGPSTNPSERRVQLALQALVEAEGDTWERGHYRYLTRHGSRDWDVVELMTFPAGKEARLSSHADVKTPNHGTGLRSFVTNALNDADRQESANIIVDLVNSPFTAQQLLDEWTARDPAVSLMILASNGRFVTSGEGTIVHHRGVEGAGGAPYVGFPWLSSTFQASSGDRPQGSF